MAHSQNTPFSNHLITVERLLEERAEVEDLRKQIISGFYEEEVPIFRQGSPIHELESTVTAEEVSGYVEKIKSLRKQLAECQAREAKLREAILSVLCDPEGVACFDGGDGDRKVIQDVIDLPFDDTALNGFIKQAKREALLEAANKFDLFLVPLGYSLRQFAEEPK